MWWLNKELLEFWVTVRYVNFPKIHQNPFKLSDIVLPLTKIISFSTDVHWCKLLSKLLFKVNPFFVVFYFTGSRNGWVIIHYFINLKLVLTRFSNYRGPAPKLSNGLLNLSGYKKYQCSFVFIRIRSSI